MRVKPLKVEPDWAVKITRCDNGYILSSIRHLEDGGLKNAYELVQCGEFEDEDDESVSLLWAVANFFGFYDKVDIKRKKND